MKRIAITGGIGSGKTLAAECLRELGYPVHSCDEIYKEVIQLPSYIEKIALEFPQCVRGGAIDRKLLSAEVFNDEEKRMLLNSISHPLIMKRLFEDMAKEKTDVVFAEVPLLFEGGYENQFDGVLVIARSQENRLRGLQNRDHSSIMEIEAKMSAQFQYNSVEGKKRLSACQAKTIANEGTKEDLKKTLRTVLSLL